MKTYEHMQTGTFLLVIYGIASMVLAGLALFTRWRRTAVFGLLVMSFAIGFFARLTVIIDQEMLELRFGLGAARKRYRLSEIASWRVVENPWYYGLGIRYTPQGWLYAVSGRTAVELQLQNGETVRIGTDDARGLCQALEDALREMFATQEKLENVPPLELTVVSGQGLQPGVDLDDSAALHDLMDGPDSSS